MLEKIGKCRAEKKRQKKLLHLLGDKHQAQRNMRVNGVKPAPPDFQSAKKQ